jgi:hypothetical protein
MLKYLCYLKNVQVCPLQSTKQRLQPKGKKMASKKNSVRLSKLHFSEQELAEARKFVALLCQENQSDEPKPWPMALARKFAPKIAQEGRKDHSTTILQMINQLASSFSFSKEKLCELMGIEKDGLDKIESMLKYKATDQDIAEGAKPLKKVTAFLKLNKRKTELMIFNYMHWLVKYSTPWGKVYFDPDDLDAITYSANNQTIDEEIDTEAKELTKKIIAQLKKQ